VVNLSPLTGEPTKDTDSLVKSLDTNFEETTVPSNGTCHQDLDIGDTLVPFTGTSGPFLIGTCLTHRYWNLLAALKDIVMPSS
jgi:hypothetical protein